MTTIPQAVTERYVSNLIHYGRNKEFDITNITRNENKVGDEVTGYYFHVCIMNPVAETFRRSCAATIAQGVRNCLIKHGVTFR
jgi:hypothetical protein